MKKKKKAKAIPEVGEGGVKGRNLIIPQCYLFLSCVAVQL